MARYGHLQGFVLTLIFCMCPTGACAGGGNNPTHERAVDFGAQLLHADDGCLYVDGKVASGDFFTDLKRIDIRGRIEYRKRGELVTDYPETVTTSIRILGNQCPAAFSESPSSIFTNGSYSLKFEVEWKNGMELRPATLSPVVAHCVGYSSATIPDRGYAIPSIECQMTVQSKGVPLADHLIVSIFEANGSRLTRLSAAP